MASCCPQALCCPRPRGNTQYPLASTSSPHRFVVTCQCLGWLVPASQDRVCLGARADLGVAGSPGSSFPTGSHVPAGSATRMTASATSAVGHWGMRVSCPSPVSRDLLGAESCVLASCSQCTGETGREAGPCSQALEEAALQQSCVVGLMEPGPWGHIQGREAGWGALMLQPRALPPGAAGWGICTFNTIQRGFVGKPLREPVP